MKVLITKKTPSKKSWSTRHYTVLKPKQLYMMECPKTGVAAMFQNTSNKVMYITYEL